MPKLQGVMIPGTALLSIEQFDTLAKGDQFDFGSLFGAAPGADLTWLVEAIGVGKEDGKSYRQYVEFKLYMGDAYLTRVIARRDPESNALYYKELE